MTEITGVQVWGAILQSLKATGALLVSLGIISGAMWFAFEDKIDNWLSERELPTMERLASIEKSLIRLTEKIASNNREFLEFQGAAIIVGDRKVRPGGVVQILYLLRRNLPCATMVQARFISERTGRIDTSLTYEIPATRSSQQEDFQSFVVGVRLPPETPPGRWSYAPILTPTNCNGYSSVQPPISEFFSVE